MQASTGLARGIRRLRADLGISQARLAEAAGLSVQFVAALEQQERSATLQTVDKLATALSVSPSELFRVGESKQNPSKTHVQRIAQVLDGLPARQQQQVLNIVRAIRAMVGTGARR